jgi:catechol 2,3-dioxygenase-like lactoylglutathione lyase family enzyme
LNSVAGAGPIVAATVAVPDAAAAAALYTRIFGYVETSAGQVPVELAESWGAPQAAGAATVWMQPASGAPGGIRLVEQPADPAYRPLATPGWSAIEILVRDTDAVAARLIDSPFEIIGPPQSLKNFPEIRATQAIGPAGEVLYLTTLPESVQGFDLPAAASLVDRVFIAVLATRSFEETLEWLSVKFAISPRPAHERGVYHEGDRYGHVRANPLSMTTLQLTGQSLIQVDEYPHRAADRPVSPGALPPGFALASLAVPSVEPFERMALSAPVRPAAAPYDGRAALTIRAPEGWLVELIESQH